MAKGKLNTSAFCEQIAKPVLEELGIFLWDVRFEKEGSGWFLRYYVDKDGGIDISDCEKFARAISPLLDGADPIDQSYCLEVSSPSIERELVKQWHFELYYGKQVTVRYFRAKDGVREIVGTLISHDVTATVLQVEGEEVSVLKAEAASIKVFDDYDYSRGEG